MRSAKGALLEIIFVGVAARNEVFGLVEKRAPKALVVYLPQVRYRSERIVLYCPYTRGRLISELEQLRKNPRRNISFNRIMLEEKRQLTRISYFAPYVTDAFLKFVIDNLVRHMVAHLASPSPSP